jgi:hypothetical protein
MTLLAQTQLISSAASPRRIVNAGVRTSPTNSGDQDICVKPRDISVSHKIILAFGGAFLFAIILCLTIFINQQYSIESARKDAISHQIVGDVDQI